MKVVGIVGDSDAGKTTVIERLVPLLSERGRVATVKSIHHDVEIDEAGKDTHRHRTAGAETVVGVTPSLTFSIEPAGKADADDETAALDRILRRLDDEGFDYVLVEGFAASPVPKVAVGDAPPARSGGEVLERVADGESADVEPIVDEVARLGAWRSGDRP